MINIKNLFQKLIVHIKAFSKFEKVCLVFAQIFLLLDLVLLTLKHIGQFWKGVNHRHISTKSHHEVTKSL